MHFVIYDVDRPDAGNLRAETRARHLGYLAAYEMHFAGPLLDSDGEICGPLMVIDLPSRVEVVDFAGATPMPLPVCSNPPPSPPSGRCFYLRRTERPSFVSPGCPETPTGRD